MTCPEFIRPLAVTFELPGRQEKPSGPDGVSESKSPVHLSKLQRNCMDDERAELPGWLFMISISGFSLQLFWCRWMAFRCRVPAFLSPNGAVDLQPWLHLPWYGCLVELLVICLVIIQLQEWIDFSSWMSLELH